MISLSLFCARIQRGIFGLWLIECESVLIVSNWCGSGPISYESPLKCVKPAHKHLKPFFLRPHFVNFLPNHDFKMKPFKLYLGGSSQMATLEITNDPGYEKVVGMVQQVRTRLFSDATLRKPLLHIFQTVYEDDSAFPQHLIPCTPIIDQVLNVVKIRAIRTSAPCDSDVVDYLTNAFPHVYLEQNGFLENDVLWGETISGRDSADKEEVALNASLIQIWLYTSNPLNPPVSLKFLWCILALNLLQ